MRSITLLLPLFLLLLFACGEDDRDLTMEIEDPREPTVIDETPESVFFRSSLPHGQVEEAELGGEFGGGRGVAAAVLRGGDTGRS